jgi:hypothetical protein
LDNPIETTDDPKADPSRLRYLEGVSPMQITIPLSHFVAYINDVKQKRRTRLDETKWLMDNFRFDNEHAAFNPQPEPPPRDYTAWMLGHSRN